MEKQSVIIIAPITQNNIYLFFFLLQVKALETPFVLIMVYCKPTSWQNRRNRPETRPPSLKATKYKPTHILLFIPIIEIFIIRYLLGNLLKSDVHCML